MHAQVTGLVFPHVPHHVGLVHPKSPPVPASLQEAHPLGCAPLLPAQLHFAPCPFPAAELPSTRGSPTVIKHMGMLTFPLKSIFWVIRKRLFLKLDIQEIHSLEQTFSFWGRNRRGLGISLSLSFRFLLSWSSSAGLEAPEGALAPGSFMPVPWDGSRRAARPHTITPQARAGAASCLAQP